MKYLTQQEVAVLLRCSVHTIARLRREAGLPWLPGRPVLIPEEEFQRWLNHRTIRGPASAATARSGSGPTNRATTKSGGPTPRVPSPNARAAEQRSSRRLRLISTTSRPAPRPKSRRERRATPPPGRKFTHP